MYHYTPEKVYTYAIQISSNMNVCHIQLYMYIEYCSILTHGLSIGDTSITNVLPVWVEGHYVVRLCTFWTRFRYCIKVLWRMSLHLITIPLFPRNFHNIPHGNNDSILIGSNDHSQYFSANFCHREQTSSLTISNFQGKKLTFATQSC